MNHALAPNAAGTNGVACPRRPRVLLSAIACCPDFGSEPGIGWGRATELARYYDVWVLANGDHSERISAYLNKHGAIPNLELVFVRRGRWDSAIAERPFLHRIAYRAWLRRAFCVAQRLHARVRFDLAHQLTIVGYR